MAKCEYRTEYWERGERIVYECPHIALTTPDEDRKKHCIFHSTNEQKALNKFDRDFKKLYENKDHAFIGFVFPNGFDFGRLREETGDFVFKDANFRGATFLGLADFQWATFSERVNFQEATFSGEADFGLATFSERANFGFATFAGKVTFFETKFSGCADFELATFAGNVNFWEATFSKRANFGGAKFSGEKNIVFYGRNFFDDSQADFRLVDFEHPENVTFDGVDLNRARFLGTDLEKINFKRVYWTNMKYETEDEEENTETEEKKRFEKVKSFFKQNINFEVIFQEIVKIYNEFVKKVRGEDRIMAFDETFQKGFTKTGGGGGEKKHYEVQQLYNLLRINYENTGRYHKAGDFFVGAMEMRRKGKRERKIIRKVLTLYKLISLYGERPFKAFVFIFIFWILFGLFFTAVGFSDIVNFWGNLGYGIIKSLDTIALGKISPEFTLNNKNLGYVIHGIQIAVNAVLIPLFILAMNRKFRRTKD